MMNYKIITTTLISFIIYIAIPGNAMALPERNSISTNNQEQQIPMEDVQRFSNALSLIKKYYVKEVDDSVLFDNAIRGMLSGLDAHSAYLDESDFKELQTSTNGEFGGLGIEVTMEGGVVKVITPLVDTPAFKAGVKAGDYIIKIDEKSVQGLELKDAVSLMRGPAGSSIKLTLVRRGENKPIVLTIPREKIEIKSVKSRMLDNKYGYVRLTQFQTMTEKDMLAAIKKLQVEAGGKLKGLVLDLRNNPGGLLDSAIEVSSSFLSKDKNGKKELVVYTQGRLPGSRFTALAQAGDIIHNAPMVVLINNGSASASEIVAGALKDNKRAIIIGTKSFGKGSVQTVLPLDATRGIKLTTALYYTPSGTSIQAKGITPDIVIEEINVPKNDKKSDFKGFSEADLQGHIKNPNKKKTTASKDSQDEIDLLHEDYQLYAALTILKGLAVAKH
ncbi:MAG: S41 family peptidase [Legionellaceae bacterium]|nr:S41 family peptidase [Legionellaceae bacterium]